MIFNLRSKIILILASVSILSFNSCNDGDDDNLEVPTTYEFSRDGVSTVNYSGQTERLDMLDLMGIYLKTSNTVGSAALSEATLVDMFKNQNAPFAGQTFGKDLFSKCFPPDTLLFLQLLQDAADASTSTVTASNGLAGVQTVGSADPTKGYRVNENGLELTQVILKGLMGSVFYYQAMEVYLSEERMGTTGNDDLETGENYTAMEHYFDEAFGYFGVPTDFPSAATLEDARFWGEYCNTRNETLYPGINDELSLAFRTARAAITAKDYEARDAAIQIIAQKWSIVIAASTVSYLEQALSTAGTPEYKRHHVMSEAIGFMLALKYHFNGGNSKYPPHFAHNHVTSALEEVGLTTNLYEVTDQQIQDAIDHLKEAFPAGEIK